MRADGMGHGVARIYAKRREALDQYVPIWVLPGQDGPASGQDASFAKLLKNKAGQDRQDKQVAKTATGEKTGTHIANSTPREEHHQEAVCAHGPDMCVVHPVRPVPTSNGAASSWTGRSGDALSVLSELRPWRRIASGSPT